MPEHVHLLLSEPERGTLAEAIHFLKLSFTKRLQGRVRVGSQVSAASSGQAVGHPPAGSFWQKRYYDRNVRNGQEFTVKLRYLHRNGEAWLSEGCGGLEVERFSALCVSRNGSGGDRVGMDSPRSGVEDVSSASPNVPEQVSVQKKDTNLGHPATSASSLIEAISSGLGLPLSVSDYSTSYLGMVAGGSPCGNGH